MVKPFEDAVFAAKEGDIVGPVLSDFGYHVILVTGVEKARQRAFDEVKGEIEADLKRQKAQAKFAQAADQLQNLVYEQADSLAPAAKAIDLTVTTTPLPHPLAGAAARAGQRQARAGAVRPRVAAGEAQHRGDRGRPERAHGGAHRRLQARGAAPLRRGEGGDPSPAGGPLRHRAGAEARPREAGEARGGRIREGGGPRPSASR